MGIAVECCLAVGSEGLDSLAGIIIADCLSGAASDWTCLAIAEAADWD